MPSRRLLIADDHPLIREGVATALAARIPDAVVDRAASVAEAEQFVRQGGRYDLVLLDYQLPDAKGFSGLFRLQGLLGRTAIAVISGNDGPTLIEAARAIGAAGFLSKSQPLEHLVGAIEHLLRGEQVFPAVPAPDAAISDLRAKMGSLSPAQMRVLLALATGRLNKQIADDLGLSEQTVKAHLSAIFRKLGTTNRLQTMLAVRPLLVPEA